MKYLGELILSDTVDDRDRGPYTIIESTAIDGNVADVYGEFPEESAEAARAIVDGMNELSTFRAEVARLQTELAKEHQTAVDLFDVVAKIAALVGLERAEPEICHKTVTAVRQLVQKVHDVQYELDKERLFIALSNATGDEEDDLFEKTAAFDEHPEWYDNACMCQLCRSYGD